MKGRRLLFLIAAAALPILGAWLSIRFAGEHLDWSSLTTFPRASAALLFSMVFIAWFCNGARTWVLARALGQPIALWRSVGITLSSEFAIAATPGGIGGLITRFALQKKEGIRYPQSAAMLSADCLADLAFFAIITPLGIHKLTQVIPSGSLNRPDLPPALWIGVLALGIAAFFLIRHKRSIATLLPKRLKTGLKHCLGKINHAIHQSMFELRLLLKPDKRNIFLLVCLIASLQWCCRYGTLWVILTALGHPVEPMILMLLQGSLLITGMLISAPGGGGSVEILSSVALAPLVGGSTAILAVMIWRFYTYYLYLAGGGMAFALQMLRKPTQTQVDQPIDPVSWTS
jgi:uncharacterized protein (TIRG00374 family)